mmetsp:Transcript_25421/g.36180  ORF Transcript_25421/g.36180 Transcript_25421/m.36180 type:complete len:340 (-) Transcript_25421:60-1079(-)
MFAGENFGRSDADSAHVVIKQPSTESEILESRAALAACPVAAIRVETEAHRHHRGSESLTPEQRTLTKQLAISPKLNGLEKPFPLKLSDNVWFVGHHSSKTFGAAPYLTKVKTQLDRNSGDEDNSGDYWILVDSPKYSKSAVDAITQLAGPAGPKYMILSHVDDTAEHGKWKEQFPDLKRIFHSGDLGKHNWVGDLTLEHVEVLLQECSTDQQLQAFSLDGTPLSADKAAQSSVVIYHTPGHSPGSITLLQRDGGVLFTGDTLGYTTRTHSLTGFPRYGNDQNQQSETLTLMETQIEGWNLVAPGHGHFRDYSTADGGEHLKKREMQEAREELAASVRT